MLFRSVGHGGICGAAGIGRAAVGAKRCVNSSADGDSDDEGVEERPSETTVRRLSHECWRKQSAPAASNPNSFSPVNGGLVRTMVLAGDLTYSG